MGGGRALAILGGVAALVVGAGLWLVLGDDGPAAGPDGGGPAEAPAAAAPESSDAAAARPAARRRSRGAGTAAFTGVVKRRAGGAPAAGQTVELLREGFDGWTADADEAGAFRLDALPDGGPYELRVAAPGCATVRLPGLGVAGGETRDVGTIWLDLAVRLPVSVRDFADRPIPAAEVRAFTAPSYGDDFDWSKAWAQMAVEPVPVATAATDAAGVAVFPEMASGRWTFVASAPGRARGGVHDVEIRSGRDVPEVVIRLGAGHRLAGRVLDTERRPVPGAIVHAGAPDDGWRLGAAATRVRGAADAEGRYALEGLAAGDVALSVAPKGGVPSVRAHVRIPSVREYDLVLAPTGSIEGKVTEKDGGAPIAGAVVRATRWAQPPEVAEATTDAEGRYRIATFPAGAINELRAVKEGYAYVPPSVPNWGGDRRVVAGETLAEDLVLHRGATVSGKVTADGAPCAGAKVVLRLGSRTGGFWHTATTSTGADGSWRLEAVPPGNAVVEAKKEGFHLPGFPAQWWMLFQDETSAREFRVDVPETGEATISLALVRGATVRGRVEGPAGPVAGATVGTGATTTTSAADGTFALEGVVPGPAVPLWATKTGLLLVGGGEAREVPADGVADVVLRLAVPAKVRGRVTAGDRAPLVDAHVVVAPRTEPQRGVYGALRFGEQGARAPVLPDGSYEASVPLTAGAFVVRAVDAALGEAESAPVAIVEGQAAYEVDLTLAPPEAVRGRVLAEGRPVRGAEVSIVPHDEPQDQGMVVWAGPSRRDVVWAVTGADGAFEARPFGTGSYDVAATAAGFVDGEKEKVAVPQQGELVVDLAPALEIAGRATFADGRPAAGVSVRALGAAESPQPFWYGGDDEAETGRATTDRDGRFRLKGLAPGNYRVRAEQRWLSRANVRTTTSEPVAAGATDVSLVVRTGAVICGVVLDGERRPVAGCWINASPEKPSGEPEWRAATTQADGTFELSGLADGTYQLHVQGAGRFAPTTRQGVASGTKELEIVLVSGESIEGVVVRPDGKPVPGLTLLAQGPAWGQTAVPTGADGKFRIAGLAAGTYELRIAEWMGSSLVLVEGATAAAGAKDVRLVASEGLRVAGVVVDEGGNPVEGAMVQPSVGGMPRQGAATDATGRFELKGLPAGKVAVSVVKPGHRPQRQELAAGTTNARFVLAPGLAIAGRLLDADGNPVGGASLHAQPEGGGEGVSAMTLPDGTFRLDGLPAGTARIAAFRQKDGTWARSELGTAEAGASGVELRLPR